MITVVTFIESLVTQHRPQDSISDVMQYGYRAGWLEEQDVLSKNDLLTRKTLARILHNFIRLELHEADVTDWHAAQKLQDLYDCRTCVNHIAQIYVKGILDGFFSQDNRFIWGMDEPLSPEASKRIIERCFTPALRQPPVSLDTDLPTPERISYETALSYLQQDKKIILIDVRSDAEYEESHLKNALPIPLMNILKNPYQVCDARDRHILLYCNEGYQSDIAATKLLECGYRDVQSFAYKK